MDNFAEQLVKKNETASDKAKRVTMAVVGTVVTLALMLLTIIQLQSFLMATLGIILSAATAFGTFYLVQSSMVEYEYTFTNGELDIDKIIAKKKRTEMLSVDVKKFTAFGKYDDSLEETEDMTVVFVSDNIASHEYYADFQHEDYGSTRLVFAPDEKILGNIKKFLPAKLKTALNQ